MALQAGSGAGDYLDGDEWIALGKEGALLACVVNGHGTQHMTKGVSAGQDIPKAEFDLYILDGSRRGEVHVGQSVIGKGLVVPLSRAAIGEEVAYRAGVGNSYGRDYPQLNAPGDLPDEAVKLFERLKAGETPAEPAKTNGPKSTGKAKAEPATVGGGSADEDPPDF